MNKNYRSHGGGFDTKRRRGLGNTKLHHKQEGKSKIKFVIFLLDAKIHD